VKLLAAVLAASALLVTGAAAAPPGPPQIRESLTPLPCPRRPKTTLQLLACAGQQILRSDAEINKRAQAIWTLLKTAVPRAHFTAAEKAWLAYRAANCRSRADVFAGGTLAKVEYANCVADVNHAHVRELQVFQAALAKR
jgi:uncharacterized protein YecT (DUF1311 family)